MNTINQEELKKIINYNPMTGDFAWISGRGNQIKAGDAAGYISQTDGYLYIRICNKSITAGRIAWVYMTGYWPEHEVDHKDRNKLNNKWINLRHMTRLCNSRNCGNRKDNTSGIKGVSWFNVVGKWRAYITVDGKQVSLGYHKLKKDAVEARWEAEKQYNFTSCNAKSSAYEYLRTEGIECQL